MDQKGFITLAPGVNSTFQYKTFTAEFNIWEGVRGVYTQDGEK